ncbi:MAG: hypothetical protein KAX58_09720, partial [Aeromonadaceae bacterium]|nr:hypothetical protein [Aeromonadaceae bacterium]
SAKPAGLWALMTINLLYLGKIRRDDSRALSPSTSAGVTSLVTNEAQFSANRRQFEAHPSPLR